ncbi:hypothetical protein RvY_10531-1 [Ramazzottius varieornatus]|uniref:MARVEL domain-containing protein n=1 Tax=Ramazzottius varieornatus TaxID=947166 RepID=A0A1D1VD21_RAMVA|nr:hypothetical protein RvY_10531-1 [Ramazzottius varieornatus]
MALHKRGYEEPKDLCRFDARCGAIVASVTTLSMSILAVLLYGWKAFVDICWSTEEDRLDRRYYYGIQTSQFVLLSSHILVLCLAITLLVGIVQEKLSLIFTWLVGFVALVCLESVCMVYSLVLTAHMHHGLDGLLEAELGFFISRLLVNGLAVYSIVSFYRELAAGRTWKPLQSNFL